MRFSGTLFYRAPLTSPVSRADQQQEDKLKEMVKQFKGWAEDDLPYVVTAFRDDNGHIAAKIQTFNYGQGENPNDSSDTSVETQKRCFYGYIPLESEKDFLFRVTALANARARKYFQEQELKKNKPTT